MTDSSFELPDFQKDGKRRHDADGAPIEDIATCGHCGRSWDDAVITDITPTPAGRCPFEYDHGAAGVAELEEAREMGARAARAVASWTCDGNTTQEAIRSTLDMLDIGDPEVSDHLPRRPDLSGEFADDLTPVSLASDVLGVDGSHIDADDIEAIADAWEEGCSDAFELACEAELLVWLDEGTADDDD